ncbi:putative mitochondrial protein AtMg01250 [Silene latifolia]|uniref:putative mitochondrial protein AtMg01250 n=1 Tax=Silene latifolia TaxID=37657 RepID=UPI003D783C8F
MLAALNFPVLFRKWIMGCISGSWFSIKVNGGVHGFFKGQSGLRQGDPLSPYLFVLSMEILSRYLRKLDTHPMVSLHPKCAKLKLTHLVFADDLMLFTRGMFLRLRVFVDIPGQFTSVRSES